MGADIDEVTSKYDVQRKSLAAYTGNPTKINIYYNGSKGNSK
jgi:hypothetical protein